MHGVDLTINIMHLCVCVCVNRFIYDNLQLMIIINKTFRMKNKEEKSDSLCYILSFKTTFRPSIRPFFTYRLVSFSM